MEGGKQHRHASRSQERVAGLSALLSAQSLAHRVGGLAAHAGQHVGVSIEGDGDGGVPEKLLDDLGMDVALQRQLGAGVPEVVEAEPRQLRTLQEQREGPMARVVPDG